MAVETGKKLKRAKRLNAGTEGRYPIFRAYIIKFFNYFYQALSGYGNGIISFADNFTDNCRISPEIISFE
jgi:hypothetical protein